MDFEFVKVNKNYFKVNISKLNGRKYRNLSNILNAYTDTH